MPKASKTLRASDILRASRRRPVLAAIAVPTAAAAAITAAGFAAAPGAAEEPQAFESKAAPEATTDDTADKQRKDAQAKAEKEQKKASSSMTLPEPEKPESDAGEKANSSSDKSGSSKSGSSKSASSKSEPKANTKASGSGGTCKASYYWQDQMTATGERFNTNDLTAAHKSLPFNSRVKVTNKANGKSVTVRINDRGPYVAGRCLDLSTAAMKAVGGTGAGVITVSYQVL